MPCGCCVPEMYGPATAYIALSVAVCIAFAALGMWDLERKLHAIKNEKLRIKNNLQPG